MGSCKLSGKNGAFTIPIKKSKGRTLLTVICSDGAGWEHVSVSHHSVIPKWDWMCKIKNLFWDRNDVVIQFHPAESDYINYHPRCLHMWRPTNQTIPVPPKILVGPY